MKTVKLLTKCGCSRILNDVLDGVTKFIIPILITSLEPLDCSFTERVFELYDIEDGIEIFREV